MYNMRITFKLLMFSILAAIAQTSSFAGDEEYFRELTKLKSLNPDTIESLKQQYVIEEKIKEVNQEARVPNKTESSEAPIRTSEPLVKPTEPTKVNSDLPDELIFP